LSESLPLGRIVPAQATIGSEFIEQSERFGPRHYWRCFSGILLREALRYLHQRERFVSSLVRPLVWLFIFAAGFRQILGVSIIPPYKTYVLYEVYITPGLCAMILLFSGMQSSLSLVYDREMGNMRTLLVSPFPRWFLLSSKLLAGVAIAVLQVYIFLAIAWFWNVKAPLSGYVLVLPALVLGGLMFGALGMLLSSVVRQLENFSGVMNFVIFPMYFASSALYPLWRVAESSPLLHAICTVNPFTHAVELIRFALYGEIAWGALVAVVGCLALFLAGAIIAYDPSRGLTARKQALGGTT
jgi:ABC-2 type transport system permease protein